MGAEFATQFVSVTNGSRARGSLTVDHTDARPAAEKATQPLFLVTDGSTALVGRVKDPRRWR